MTSSMRALSRGAVGLCAALLAAGMLALWVGLHTDLGRRWSVRTLEQTLADRTGATVRLGRLQGSWLGAGRVEDVFYQDARQGIEFRVEELSWRFRPGGLIRGVVDFDHIDAASVHILRRPAVSTATASTPSASAGWRQTLGEVEAVLAAEGLDLRIGRLSVAKVVVRSDQDPPRAAPAFSVAATLGRRGRALHLGPVRIRVPTPGAPAAEWVGDGPVELLGGLSHTATGAWAAEFSVEASQARIVVTATAAPGAADWGVRSWGRFESRASSSSPGGLRGSLRLRLGSVAPAGATADAVSGWAGEWSFRAAPFPSSDGASAIAGRGHVRGGTSFALDGIVQSGAANRLTVGARLDLPRQMIEFAQLRGRWRTWPPGTPEALRKIGPLRLDAWAAGAFFDPEVFVRANGRNVRYAGVAASDWSLRAHGHPLRQDAPFSLRARVGRVRLKNTVWRGLSLRAGSAVRVSEDAGGPGRGAGHDSGRCARARPLPFQFALEAGPKGLRLAAEGCASVLHRVWALRSIAGRWRGGPIRHRSGRLVVSETSVALERWAMRVGASEWRGDGAWRRDRGGPGLRVALTGTGIDAAWIAELSGRAGLSGRIDGVVRIHGARADAALDWSDGAWGAATVSGQLKLRLSERMLSIAGEGQFQEAPWHLSVRGSAPLPWWHPRAVEAVAPAELTLSLKEFDASVLPPIAKWRANRLALAGRFRWGESPDGRMIVRGLSHPDVSVPIDLRGTLAPDTAAATTRMEVKALGPDGALAQLVVGLPALRGRPVPFGQWRLPERWTVRASTSPIDLRTWPVLSKWGPGRVETQSRIAATADEVRGELVVRYGAAQADGALASDAVRLAVSGSMPTSPPRAGTPIHLSMNGRAPGIPDAKAALTLRWPAAAPRSVSEWARVVASARGHITGVALRPLGAPVDGTIDVHGAYTRGRADSDVLVRAKGLRWIDDQPLVDAQLRLTANGDRLRWTATASAAGQRLLDAVAEFAPPRRWPPPRRWWRDGRGYGRWHSTELKRWLVGTPLAGALSGQLAGTWNWNHEGGDGRQDGAIRARVVASSFRSGGHRLGDIDFAARWGPDDPTYALSVGGVGGPDSRASRSLPLRVSVQGGPHGRIRVEAHRFPLGALSPGLLALGTPIQALEGAMSGTLSMDGVGPGGAGRVEGRLELSEFAPKFAPPGPALRPGRLTMWGSPEGVLYLDGRWADLGDGRVVLAGRMPFAASPAEAWTLSLGLDGVRAHASGASSVVDAKVEASIHRPSRRGDGWRAGVRLSDARVDVLREKRGRWHPISQRPDVRYGALDRSPDRRFPWPRTRRAAQAPVRLSIKTETPIRVRGDEVTADVRADLALAPGRDGAVVGDGAVVATDGTLRLFGRRWRVDTARLRFVGRAAPEVEVRLERQVSDWTVWIDVSGPLPAPVLRFSARPPTLSEDELLAVVMGGHPNAPSPGRSASATAKAAGVAAGYLARPLQDRLQDTLPLDTLRLQVGDGAKAEALTLGKWITDRLFLAYDHHFDARPGENAHEATLQYQLLRGLLFESRYGDQGSGSGELLWSKRFAP